MGFTSRFLDYNDYLKYNVEQQVINFGGLINLPDKNIKELDISQNLQDCMFGYKKGVVSNNLRKDFFPDRSDAVNNCNLNLRLRPKWSEWDEIKKESNLDRFVRSYSPIFVNKYNDYWNCGLDFVYRRVDKSDIIVKKFFDIIINGVGKNEDELREWLSRMSDVYKKYGPRLTPYWKDLVNLDRLGGYVTRKDDKDLEAEVKRWVFDKTIHELPGINFLEWYKQELRKLFRIKDNGIDFENFPTFSDFIYDIGYWARTGSSNLSPKLDWEGSRLKRTKWLLALTVKLERIEKLCLEQQIPVLSVIQKLELGKVRGVISVGDVSFLQQAYYMLWVESRLKGGDWCTLYMTQEQRMIMWQQMAVVSEDKSVWKIPVDQSKFDQQPNREMMETTLEVVGDWIRESGPADCYSVFEVQTKMLLSTRAVVRVGTERVEYRKGVLSGWRITSFIDSIINYAEFKVMERYVRTFLGIQGTVLNLVVQGDDDLVWVDNKYFGAAILSSYEQAGFKVNPGKVWIENDRDEFLRKVAWKGEVSGYVVRAVPSIFWRNPVNRDPPQGFSRLEGQLDSWNTLISRGWNMSQIYEDALLDMYSANKTIFQNKKQMMEVLITPKANGGLGWVALREEMERRRIPYNLSAYETSQELNKVILPYKEDVFKDFPVDEERKKGMWRKLVKQTIFTIDSKGLEIDKEGQIRSAFRASFTGKDYNFDINNGKIGPRFDVSIPLSGRSSYIETIRNKEDYDEKLFDNDTNLESRRVLQYGGKRVWLEWIKGRLPLGGDVFYRYGKEQFSYFVSRFFKRAWNGMIWGQHFNMSILRGIAVRSQMLALAALGGQRKVGD